MVGLGVAKVVVWLDGEWGYRVRVVNCTEADLVYSNKIPLGELHNLLLYCTFS